VTRRRAIARKTFQGSDLSGSVLNFVQPLRPEVWTGPERGLTPTTSTDPYYFNYFSSTAMMRGAPLTPCSDCTVPRGM
jgi:hypothetical protein